ncbi:hypothetical protein DYB35_013324, partial [Aphanomyces astaci]
MDKVFQLVKSEFPVGQILANERKRKPDGGQNECFYCNGKYNEGAKVHMKKDCPKRKEDFAKGYYRTSIFKAAKSVPAKVAAVRSTRSEVAVGQVEVATPSGGELTATDMEEAADSLDDLTMQLEYARSRLALPFLNHLVRFGMKVLLALVALPYATGATDFNAQAKVIVDGMTIDQLIGQMTQVNINYVIQDQNAKKVVDPSKVEELANQRIGSYLNSPFSLSTAANVTGWSATEWRSAISQIQTTHKATTGHPIIYGVDSLHGANYVQNAVLFPHQINVGATFDPAFASQMGRFAGRDTRAAGIHWIFGPCLDPPRHKGWPRIMETFGEDPAVVADMGRAIVQ